MSAPGYLELGGIIAALEAEDPRRVLPFGFHNPHSYRGYYNQLAFEPAANISIRDMLAAARSALGATFQGWKGGDYTMAADTDCWLANEGDCSNDQIGPVLLTFMLAQPTVELLEEPPALPAEPALGSAVRLVNSRTTSMGRLFERYDEGWFEARDNAGLAPKTWAELNAMGTVTPLVPVPLLAELVEALRKSVHALHVYCNHADDADCLSGGCEYRNLLTKVAGEVAA